MTRPTLPPFFISHPFLFFSSRLHDVVLFLVYRHTPVMALDIYLPLLAPLLPLHSVCLE